MFAYTRSLALKNDETKKLLLVSWRPDDCRCSSWFFPPGNYHTSWLEMDIQSLISDEHHFLSNFQVMFDLFPTSYVGCGRGLLETLTNRLNLYIAAESSCKSVRLFPVPNDMRVNIWYVIHWWQSISRWWFHMFFIFTPFWGNAPIWPIFVRWVGSTTD